MSEATSSARSESLTLLRHPATIRARCRAILAAVDDERSAWFRVERQRLNDAAARVAALTRQRFADLQIPPHSRWRHFDTGGVARIAELDACLAQHSRAEALRARIDLTVLSVLLDADAGAAWRYDDRDGASLARSEGLAVACLRAFMAGRFSAIDGDPCRADAGVLARVDTAALREVFQVRANNPLAGLEPRAALIARFGRALAASGQDAALPPRPSRLIDMLGLGNLDGQQGRPGISAAALLLEVLRLTEAVATQGAMVMGRPVGDVWPHRFAGAAVAGGGADAVTTGMVPFHARAQWLTYSLHEPLLQAGIEVSAMDELTALPGHRNGGLLLDSGVIVPREPRLAERRFKPGEEPIVKWRALTVALLDELAAHVRQRLGGGASALSMACIMEGGTWAAGREIAAELREGGAPPLRVDGDTMLF